MLASGCIRRIFLLFVILLLFLFLSSSCTCQQWCSNLTSRKTFCQNVRHFLYRFSHALSIAFLSLFLILSSFPFSLRRFTALWSLHSPSNFASQTSQFFSFLLMWQALCNRFAGFSPIFAETKQNCEASLKPLPLVLNYTLLKTGNSNQ